MKNRSTLQLKLKGACRLTGAIWAAIIYHNGDQLEFSNSCNLSTKEIINIKKGIISIDEIHDYFFGQSNKLKKTIIVNDFINSGFNRIYFFPLTLTRTLAVGTNKKMELRNQNIWKLVIIGEEQINFNYSNGEVDLLQNAVMELQMTQQELQARISAQKEAEAQLIQAAKLAAVGEMAAGIAHELNNPLTSVVGFTELSLEDLPTESNARKDLELVLQEARRAQSVVSRLLDFSRQSEKNRVKADLNEIFEEVLTLLHHLIQIHNVELEINLGDNLEWVSVDRNQIKQVIINLVNNALYALSEGGKIKVETAKINRYGRNWVTFSVQDNGMGISPQNLERIFEPFFTTRGDRGGTGLGLSVTYGIVTDHKGMIEVVSQVDVGSTFQVWLPLEEKL